MNEEFDLPPGIDLEDEPLEDLQYGRHGFTEDGIGPTIGQMTDEGLYKRVGRRSGCKKRKLQKAKILSRIGVRTEFPYKTKQDIK